MNERIEALASMGYWTIERHTNCVRLRTRLTNVLVFLYETKFNPNSPRGLLGLLGRLQCKIDEKRMKRIIERRKI